MSDLELSNLGRVSKLLPQALADNTDTDLRLSRYGEQVAIPLVPTKHALADEGSYFVATNPTPGTGIQLNANVNAFSDTNALFVINNTEQAASAQAKRIYLDYLKLLLLATAPTGTVSMEFALKRSTISREPTTAANRTLLVPANLAGASSRATIARVMSYANAGAMTVPASLLSDPVLSRARIVTSLGIAGDEYLVKFGGDDMSVVQGLTAARAAAVARIATSTPPIIVEPGEWLVIHMWWLTSATTAATFEFELAWWER